MSGAGATLPAAVPARPPPVQAGNVSADVSAVRRHVPDICFDAVFYWALPGRTNYCLGMKAWTRGHYRESLELLKLAAGWGNKSAQYTLGLIYYNGHHVQAKPSLGIAWLKLADERHDDAGVAQATRAAVHWATPAERTRADRLLLQMRATYGDKVAAARAWHHLQHWRLSHGGPFASGCQVLYGAQAYYAGLLGGDLGLPSISIERNNKPAWHGLGCLPMQQKRQMVTHAAAVYFHGWMGTVTVEPLEQVPAPAASSSH